MSDALDQARAILGLVRPIAALYVMTDGHYFNLPGVDVWDEPRNAMTYAGDLPVVAHPPCQRWCRLAGFVEFTYGIPKHQDGGTFEHALAMVRRNGGVLEHPAYSAAWPHFGIAKPPPEGGWVIADEYGGRTCHVEQRWYGHRARKATWLYAVRCDLLEFKWGHGPEPTAWISSCTKRGDGSYSRPRKGVDRMGKVERNATPLPFRDILIAMARSVRNTAAQSDVAHLKESKS